MQKICFQQKKRKKKTNNKSITKLATVEIHANKHPYFSITLRKQTISIHFLLYFFFVVDKCTANDFSIQFFSAKYEVARKRFRYL